MDIISVFQLPCDFDEIYNVICTAEMYLLPGLKRLCTNAMVKILDVSNVVDAARVSRTFSMPRLESECCRFIAEYMDEVRDLPQSYCVSKQTVYTSIKLLNDI